MYKEKTERKSNKITTTIKKKNKEKKTKNGKNARAPTHTHIHTHTHTHTQKNKKKTFTPGQAGNIEYFTTRLEIMSNEFQVLT